MAPSSEQNCRRVEPDFLLSHSAEVYSTWNFTCTYLLRHCDVALRHRVLRRMFGPKRKEVVGSWRRLHDEELHNFYT